MESINEEPEFKFTLTSNTVENGTYTCCSRILVIANALPLWCSEDQVATSPSKIAGIVPAMENLKKSGAIKEYLFFGHPPHSQESQCKQTFESKLKELSCVAINTPPDLYDSYKNGYCKSSLWPLLHYRLHNVKHNVKWFEAYKKVNEIYADAILEHCRLGDTVWIHDYHLMLLPTLLRERLPRGVPLGFFFHVPFPSSELFRVLPDRNELLNGVLGSDLIGFQTFEYVRHFESSVSRLLGAECIARGIESPSSGGHFVRVDVFPGGIDFNTFAKITNSKVMKERVEHLKTLFKDKHVLVSRDRVDEIEGVPLKLHALENFWKKYPQWKGKVVLFQIYEPQDEIESEEVKSLQREVNETVGRLNGIFGAVDYVPIEYVNKRLHLEEICALYSVAKVALVTPIRDGLNLVSHEYVACQGDENPGVVILSEFTGAARCLSGARLVNPFDTNDFADALHEALTISEEDRLFKHEYDFDYVKTNTSTDWAKHFFDELKCTVAQLMQTSIPMVDIDVIGCTYSRSIKQRLFLLDYDGTLSPLVKHPKLAVPSPQVITILEKLAKNPLNKVFVISGRDGDSLESWLGHLDVGLACEHGAFIKPSGATEWQQMAAENDISTSWRQSIVSVMEDFADRTPGAFVELKRINVAWHYRGSDPEYGSFQARELMQELQAVACKFPIDIIHGKKCIEVKPLGVGKGEVVKKILSEHRDVDFVFCIGDDKTDEDMFAQFSDSPRSTHYTCCVMSDAKRSTLAKYWVETYTDVLDILSEFVAVDAKSSSATVNTANRLFPPLSLRQLRRNSLLGFGASSKKKFLPTSLLGSCGIVQQAQSRETTAPAQILQE